MFRTHHFIIILFCVVFISALAVNTVAQDKPPATDTVKSNRPHNLIFELGGPGFFYSINYDTRFANRRDGWGMRGGFGWLTYRNELCITVPVQVNYLLGERRNFLEIGAGATYAVVGSTDNTNALFGFSAKKGGQVLIFTGTIGYRFQPLKHGVNFGASFNPLYSEGDFVPYMGLWMGWTF